MSTVKITVMHPNGKGPISEGGKSVVVQASKSAATTLHAIKQLITPICGPKFIRGISYVHRGDEKTIIVPVDPNTKRCIFTPIDLDEIKGKLVTAILPGENDQSDSRAGESRNRPPTRPSKTQPTSTSENAARELTKAVNSATAAAKLWTTVMSKGRKALETDNNVEPPPVQASTPPPQATKAPKPPSQAAKAPKAPRPSTTAPKPKRPTSSSTDPVDDVVAAVQNLLENVSDETDAAVLTKIKQLYALVDEPQTRARVRYAIKLWRILYANHFNKNLCWITSAMQGATGVTMIKRDVVNMHTALRNFVKFLLDTLTAEGLYNLFFERSASGQAGGSQLPELNLGGTEGPANLARALRELASKQPGDSGGRLEHVVLATLLRAEIHVHDPRGYVEKGDGGYNDGTLRVCEESIYIYTPAGMKRGVAQREVHVVFNGSHFDTILGASEVFFKTDADRDPSKILELAKKYVLELAAANSETNLREVLGAEFNPADHRPISMKAAGGSTSAVDLTGSDSPGRPRRRPSSHASLEASMAALQHQIATLAQQIAALVPKPSGSGTGSGSGGSRADGSGGAGGPGDDGSGDGGSNTGGSGPGSDGSGPGTDGSGSGSSTSGGSGPDMGDSGGDGGGPRGGGAPDPTAIARDKQAMRDAVLSLLNSAGDDLATETFLSISKGRFCDAEPDARPALISTLVNEIGATLEPVIESPQRTRTKTANTMFGRLANYALIQKHLNAAQKRALLERGVPLLQSINPNFTLDANQITSASNFSAAEARAILSSPAAAGSQ